MTLPLGIGVLTLVISAASGDVPANADPGPRRCLACHLVTVAEHLHDWDRSVHARAGVTCTSCHVPQPSGPGPAVPGAQDRPAAAITCGSCHVAIATAFRTSQHATQARGTTIGPTCTDCHTRAGGNVLVPERFAESCGRCHQDKTAKGDLVISRRAIDVLDKLRRVALASALVGQQLDAHRRNGTLAQATAQRFTDLGVAIDDLAVEWHRFDFAAVDNRCRRVLDKLETLHSELLEQP
jgi:hypothetical protein